MTQLENRSPIHPGEIGILRAIWSNQREKGRCLELGTSDATHLSQRGGAGTKAPLTEEELMKLSRLSALCVTLITAGFALTGCATDDGVQGGEVLRSAAVRDTSPSVTTDAQQELVEGNTAFALNLYRVLAEEDDGNNLFCSPYSISIALAMTYAGARGETATEMADALHYTLAQEELHPAFNWLDLTLESRGADAEGSDGEPFRLSVVNATWGQAGYPFLEDYLDVLAINYGAGLRTMDFVGAPDPSRIEINDWVTDQTEGRIEDLLPEGSITSDTRLVLTNAIYFNAAWANKFDEDFTRDGEFTLIDGSTVTTDMMHQEETFGYVAGEGYQALELPYDGNEISMVVLLPDAGTLPAFEASLDAAAIHEITDSIEYQQVAVTMPRFTFDSGFSLVETMRTLGMEQAFTGAADLSGMAEGGDLMITDIFHKAFVLVDESGTEAAAATAVVVGETSVEPPALEMTVDRPFLFLIRDIETGAVLFLGRVLDPTA